jgi:hypothetical protein
VVYRPIDIQIQLTQAEAEALLVRVGKLDPLADALEQAIAGCKAWGRYPAPQRALVVGLEARNVPAV